MFFCEKCRKRNEWPEGYFKSFGNCEICEVRGPCHDVRSSALPIPKPKKKVKK